MNVLLTLSYDGTNYCGWQRQKNGISVQQRLEEALESVLGKPITVTGASRTDAGVHALGQHAVFSKEAMSIPLDKLPYALNSHLPPDISVIRAESVNDDFHPIYSAKRKTYEYSLYMSQFRNPLLERYCCHINHELNLDLMNEACKYFLGEHDFAAFRAIGSSVKTTVRTIYSLDIITEGNIIKIRICGNGFLYNMVRIIAGTLVYVGNGKIKAADIPCIILSKNRENAGKTMPPHGLTLVNIEYYNELTYK